METIQLSQDWGGGGLTPITSWLPCIGALRGYAPTLNLRGLNTYLRVSKFRMETFSSVIQGLYQDWWMVSLVLKDAYLHVPIRPSHWPYLRFALRNAEGQLIVYQWKVFPFGLATAPRVFAKLLAPVVAHLHMQECLMYPYIDNIFHAQVSFLQACHLTLGFIVNFAKSALVPSRVMLYLGAMIETALRHRACSSGTALSYSGVSWIPLSHDRPSAVLPFLSSTVHVSSPPSVDPPEGPLRHEG